jgi:hypothetical protein
LNTNIEKMVLDKARALDNPKLPELVDKLVKDNGLKFNDASEAVYVMWKKGELTLSEPKPISSLHRYTSSLESSWFWALTALVVVTVLISFTVVDSVLIYFRYILGGVFVLFLPGAMLIAALYPKSEDMDTIERLALSIGLSLAVVPLIGLLLNYTPWGITLTPIMISLAIFTEAMAFAALVRKYRYFQLDRK